MTMQEFQVFEALSFAFLQPPDIPVAGLYAIIKTVYFSAVGLQNSSKARIILGCLMTK